jgi:hypothetical protein
MVVIDETLCRTSLRWTHALGAPMPSGIHGDGDPVMITFVFLSIFFLEYTCSRQGVEDEHGVTNWLSAGFWRLGSPWYYANADQLGPWRGEIILVEITTWISVVVLLGFQVRSAAGEGRAAESPSY